MIYKNHFKKTFVALTSIYDLYVNQMDVKIAFLIGDINEEIYMRQLNLMVCASWK